MNSGDFSFLKRVLMRGYGLLGNVNLWESALELEQIGHEAWRENATLKQKTGLWGGQEIGLHRKT